MSGPGIDLGQEGSGRARDLFFPAGHVQQDVHEVPLARHHSGAQDIEEASRQRAEGLTWLGLKRVRAVQSDSAVDIRAHFLYPFVRDVPCHEISIRRQIRTRCQQQSGECQFAGSLGARGAAYFLRIRRVEQRHRQRRSAEIAAEKGLSSFRIQTKPAQQVEEPGAIVTENHRPPDIDFGARNCGFGVLTQRAEAFGGARIRSQWRILAIMALTTSLATVGAAWVGQQMQDISLLILPRVAGLVLLLISLEVGGLSLPRIRKLPLPVVVVAHFCTAFCRALRTLVSTPGSTCVPTPSSKAHSSACACAMPTAVRAIDTRLRE